MMDAITNHNPAAPGEKTALGKYIAFAWFFAPGCLSVSKKLGPENNKNHFSLLMALFAIHEIHL
jgi:hypothetical protein